jgi:lipopolysaccharide/colanic/teichoic acid biosynthesis glycosyltransferase
VLDAALATGCAVVAPSRLRTVAGAGPQVIWAHGAPLVALARPGARTGQLFLKRLVDVAGALTALILLAPMMVLVAVAIRLGSRGPVIFGQTRIGEGGRPFRCLKFRSMRADAEDLLRGDPELYERYVQNDFKLPEGQDPRITSLGRVIRRTSIDELPQLWNVLRGEMSLVGPRPLVPDELNRYGDGAAVLLALKPGVSGAWAVNGRSTVAYPQRADIELTYVRNWRLGVDLSILARTVPAVFRHYGAH